jgi:hypothetical protein
MGMDISKRSKIYNEIILSWHEVNVKYNKQLVT